MLGVITIYCLEQIMSSKEDLEQYPSLKHYRNACSKRMSLDDILAFIVHEISRVTEPSDSVNDDAVNPDQVTPSNPNPTHRRSTMMTVKMEMWLKPSTGHSPKRNVKKFYSPDDETICEGKQKLYTRRLECSGNAVYRVHYDDAKKEINPKGDRSRSTCVQCKQQTNVFCSICKV
jgi:hypothetical protein